jgi:hypothetical protein
MIRRISSVLALAVVALATVAQAQSTGMPSYNAPYRAFEKYEFGGTLSFPDWDAGIGLEGQFRFGYKTWDMGVQGGIFDPDGVNGNLFLLGATSRVRVVTHGETFPLDGALILGVGTQDFDNAIVPAGISLGRRVDFEGSTISIVPYGQPTLFMVFDDNDASDTINFGLGLGVDVRFGRAFDIRASFGIGDVDGFAVSAVWVR